MFQHIVSIPYSVMYYLNAFIIKWDMHKLCRLSKRLPSGQIFLWTTSLMISSSSPLSFTEHPGTRHYHSNIERLFKQKWEKKTSLSFPLYCFKFLWAQQPRQRDWRKQRAHFQSYWLSEMRALYYLWILRTQFSSYLVSTHYVSCPTGCWWCKQEKIWLLPFKEHAV